MWEVLEAALATVNLPYTVFLGLILLYWLTVIVGVLDLDLFNIEVETDVDTDVDAAVPGLGGVGLAVLRFLHVDTVPLMLLLSFFALSLWVLSLLSNYYLRNASLLVAGLLFVPNVLASLCLTKCVTLPFRALFKTLHHERQVTPEILGQVCVVKTSKVDTISGQAEMASNGAPLLLNVRTAGGEVLDKGEEALIVQFNEKTNTYIVARL
jgi:hypothetical protein